MLMRNTVKRYVYHTLPSLNHEGSLIQTEMRIQSYKGQKKEVHEVGSGSGTPYVPKLGKISESV